MPGAHYFTAVPTAGSPENIRLLSSDQAQVATVVGSVAYASYFGRGTDKKDDLRMLLAFSNPIGFHFQVPKDSPLKTVYELKGKKVAFGVKGSGDHAMVKHVFEAIGLDMDRDFRAQYLPIREMVDAFKDGKVDGAFKVGPDPQQELHHQHAFNCDKGRRDKIQQKKRRRQKERRQSSRKAEFGQLIHSQEQVGQQV